MELGINGKYALVTGGTHGIGRAIALSLADEGCNVAVCSRTKEWVDSTRDEIETKGVKAIGIQADVTEDAGIESIQKTVEERWGKIDILINNVGGGGRWGSDVIEETDEKVWQEVYDKNTNVAVKLTVWAIPFMRQSKWGRVVTITSIFGREAGGRPWFTMAKTAQTSLMKSLAKKSYLVQDGITFNSVAPGAIMIEGTGWEKASKENPAETEKFIKDELPIGRFGRPEEVAQVVTFICSSNASLVNGVSAAVDGGQGNSLF